MDRNFIQLKYTGKRFINYMLPIDVIRDLSAYEALLIDLAKYLFLRDNPERQRVPRGFSDMQLAIVNVEKGSAMPTLALVSTEMQNVQMSLFDNNISDYFIQARDLISECIETNVSELPNKIPIYLLTYFNKLGRSLREGEKLELPIKNSSINAILDLNKRKNLVLAANKAYEREVELNGFIGDVDYEKGTFRLRLTDGSQVVAPMPEYYIDVIRQSGGRNRDYVYMKGIALYDSYEHLQKILN